jgi:hypothetical protein
MTNSDSTFLVAIAIIACMVVLFVAVAGFILLRSQQKKEIPAPANDEPQPVPPVEFTVAPQPEETAEDALPSIPLVEVLPASLPEEVLEPHVLSYPSVEIIASPEEVTEKAHPAAPPLEILSVSPPEETPESEPPSRPGVIQSLWGIVLTTALMFALTLAMVYAINVYSIFGVLLMLVGFPLGIALAGTVGIRLTHLQGWLRIVPILLFLAGLAILRLMPFYTNYQFLLVMAALGALFVPLMNREGKEVSLSLRSINWFVCFILASLIAFWGYLRLLQILGPPLPIPRYFYWFAIMMAFVSPACVAIAWLRLTGTRWRTALLMIPSVPLGVFIIGFITAVTAN